MAQDVFRIQGVVELVADRAHRTLVTFQRTVVQSSRTMQNAFAGLDRAIGSFAAAFTGLQFQKLAGAFIQASIKAETFRTQLNLIVKDQEKINNLISFVEQYEAKTPFNLPELQKATVLFTKLTKVRDESIEKVPEYLKLAAEMSAIFDKPLEKATEGLFKTFSGSALGLTILRNNFAITKAELQKFGVAFDNSGRIKNFSQQIDVVEQAIRKIIMGLSGMKLAEARSFTLAGRIEKLGSEVYRTARIFGDVMAPYVGTIIDRLVDLQQALQNLSPEMKFIITSVVGFGAALGTLVLTFGPVLYFLSMGAQGMMAFGTATARVAGTAGLVGLTTSIRGLMLTNIPVFLGLLFTQLRGIGVLLAAGNSVGAVSGFSLLAGAFALAAQQAGGVLAGIRLIITDTARLGMQAISSTALFRTGLYSVAAGAIAVLAQLQKITAWQNQLNQQDQSTLDAQDPKKYRKALEMATPGKEQNIGPMNPASASLDAAAASATALRTPQMEALMDKLGGADGIREQIKVIEDNRKAQQAKLGIQDQFVGEDWTNWITGASRTQAEEDQRSKRTLKNKAFIRGFNTPEEKAELARIKQSEETRAAMNSPDFVGGSKRAEEALKYYKELLPVAEQIEKAFTGMSLADATEQFEALKRSEKLDKQSVEKTVKELTELRKNGYDTQGKLKEQYKEFDKKIEMEIFKYADKLMQEKHSKIEASQAITEAKGEMTAEKELEFLRQRQKAIQETADQSGVLTDKMVQEYNKLYVEELKLRHTVIKERRTAEIEVTRITEGEHVAKLKILNDETKEKKKAGWSQVQVAAWRAQQELQIEHDRVTKQREIEQQITDIKQQAAEAQVNAARDAAEWGYNRGGSFEGLMGANRAADELENARAKEARDRAIREAEEKAKIDVDYAKKAKEHIRAIEEEYAAAQKARSEQRARRDVEMEERDQQKKAEIALAQAEVQSEGMKAELGRLQQMQEQGLDVHEQIVWKLREQYQFEVGIIRAKAEADKIGKSLEQQKIIDMQATQAILQLTQQQTSEMQKQLDLKKTADSEKRNKMFFKGGHMTMEEMAELDKQRAAEDKARYDRMVQKERMRSGGVSKGMQDAANKLGVPGEVQRQAFQINVPPVKVAPIEINGTFTLVDPYGNKQTIRQKTSTEKKNEDTKSQTNQKGKNVL